MADDILLDVINLKVYFPLPKSHLFAPQQVVHAVDDVSFKVKRGTTFGVVGESGSGKTTTALAVMRLVKVTSGSMSLNGVDLASLEKEELRKTRRHMQMIFQDPYSSLNPRVRAGEIVREPMELMKIGTKAEQAERVDELFRNVGLRPEQQALFPHQFSGGMRQRVMIAMSLAKNPSLLIADEPTTALDVTIQAQILDLMLELKDQNREAAIVLITHDMAVVAETCERVMVMYGGMIQEVADVNRLFDQPLHPYTQGLLKSIPHPDEDRPSENLQTIAGVVPNILEMPEGCKFCTRCDLVEERCKTDEPPLVEILPDHFVRCFVVADGESNGQ